MRKTRFSVFSLVLLTCLTGISALPSFAQSKPPNETNRLHMLSKPAIVRIVSGYTGRWQLGSNVVDTQSIATGSGFIINPNGYILTNAHVVDSIKEGDDAGKRMLLQRLAIQLLQAEGKPVTGESVGAVANYLINAGVRLIDFQRINLVFLQSGSRYPYEIKSYGAPLAEGKDLSTGKDVAVVKIEVKNAPTLRLGNSDDMQVGDPIWILGYPGAADAGSVLDSKSQLEPTTNDGKISAKKTSADGMPVLQTNTSTAPGNSGGPAINDKGEVIGLLTFGSSETQGFNFLVPVNTAQEFVRQAGTDNTASPIDAKWREGLDYYWDRQYRLAQGSFSEVVTLFQDHSEAARLITDSQERIIKGEDESGFALLGGIFLAIIVGGFLLFVGGVAIVIVLVMKRNKKKAAQAGAPPRPAAPAPVYNNAPAQRPAGPQVSTAPAYQTTVRLDTAPQATEVFAAAGSMGRLVFTQGPLKGQEFPIGQGVYIGRDNTRSQIVVTDPQVSGQHLWIGQVNGRVIARDNGSTNGTFLNNQMSQRVTEVELQDRDELTLGGQGSVKFTFHR